MINKVALAIYIDNLFIAKKIKKDIFYIKQLLK